MAWLSLKIEADDKTADLLSDALMELGALSASIEDAHAETPEEQAIFGEPGDPPPGIWQRSVVNALFAEDADTIEIMQSLQKMTGLCDLAYSTEQLADQDWVRTTQSQFKPICINDNLWIVPSWHEPPDPDALNIILDPGLAFGTGSHPTTHLCLQWLAPHINNQQTVLDYGCGSGVLAIAAKKMGAARVIGTDIDNLAIDSSNFNAGRNQVDAEFYLPEQLPQLQAEIVVANILSSALMVLAPALASACKKQGKIALSGILEPQAALVSDVYKEWFDMETPILMEGWALLTGTKR